MTKAQHIGTGTGVLQQSDNALYCRLVGKLSDGTVFADHQADDNLLQLVVGEGEPQANPCRVVISVACGFRRHNVHAADNDKKLVLLSVVQSVWIWLLHIGHGHVSGCNLCLFVSMPAGMPWSRECRSMRIGTHLVIDYTGTSTGTNTIDAVVLV